MNSFEAWYQSVKDVGEWVSSRRALNLHEISGSTAETRRSVGLGVEEGDGDARHDEHDDSRVHGGQRPFGARRRSGRRACRGEPSRDNNCRGTFTRGSTHLCARHYCSAAAVTVGAGLVLNTADIYKIVYAGVSRNFVAMDRGAAAGPPIVEVVSTRSQPD